MSKDLKIMANYDNLDMLNTKKNKYLRYIKEDLHLITIVIIKNPEIPNISFVQNIYYPE
jgi:hypothetical protein